MLNDLHSNNFAVSVIIPLFNGEKYIENCIKSVLAQSYQHFEIIIVNDGSTDSSAQIVQNFVNHYPNKIKLYQHPNNENKGIAETRNLGIKMASYPLIAFIDQDDLWASDKLSIQIEYLKKFPEAKLIYSQASLIDSNGLPFYIDKSNIMGKGIGYIPINIFKQLLKENFIPSPTVLTYKYSIEKAGMFDTKLKNSYEDWILWTKIAFKEKVLFIPKPLTFYRIHKENYSLKRTANVSDFLAEKHYIESVFNFLFDQEKSDYKKINKILSRQIQRFLFRAKSWGIDNQSINNLANSLISSFPTQKSNIKTTLFLTSILNKNIAKLIRRFRRKIIGIR